MRLLCCSIAFGLLAACGGSSAQATRPGSGLNSSHNNVQSTPTSPESDSNKQLSDEELGVGSKTGASHNGSSGGFVMSNQQPQSGGSSLSPSRPPSREPPPSNPNSGSSSGGFVLAQPTSAPPPPPPPPPSSSDPDVERARAVLVAAAFERALNSTDTSQAEKVSTAGCWQKECASIARQAQTKFKVKLLPGVSQVGTRGLAEMDVLCGGTRQCDKVWLLLEKDCMSGTRFVVADVTEDKPKRDAWLKNAPSVCGGSSTASTTSSSSSSSSSSSTSDVRTAGSTATRPIPDADRVIAGLRPRLKACHLSGILKDPKMAGRVTYTIAVAADGSVTTANVASNSGISFDVVTCQVGVFKRAQFSAPGGSGSTLTVPITMAVGP